jgi:hypothetical protein
VVLAPGLALFGEAGSSDSGHLCLSLVSRRELKIRGLRLQNSTIYAIANLSLIAAINGENPVAFIIEGT